MNTISRSTGRNFTITALAAALVLAALASPRRAAAQVIAQPEGDKWAVAVALDPWVPTINGDLRYSLPTLPGGGGGSGGHGGNLDLKIGPNDYLTHLNFAIPLVIDIRNKQFSILTDVMYINFRQDTNLTAVKLPGGLPITINTNLKTSSSLKGLLWNEAFGWTAAGTPSGSFLDVIAGVRYFGLKSETHWHLLASIEGPNGGEPILQKDGTTSHNQDLFDGIVGVRGNIALGKQWSIPYYGDIGAGSSKVTWQGSLGINFAPGKWDFALSYRHISWEQKDDKFVQSLRMGGPELLIGYRF